jgi:carboxyl-terminal processing protease
MKARIKLFLIALLVAPQFAHAANDTEATTAKIAKSIADRLPKIHLNRLDFDDNIATNALQVFVDSLDYRHSYFLQSDIDTFQEKALKMDDWLKEGQVRFAQEIYDTFLDRVSNRVDYVNALLDTGFDTSLNETYHWKRDDAPWPKDQSEWDEHWRRLIKSEYINRLVSSQLDEEDRLKKAAEAPLDEEVKVAAEVDPETSEISKEIADEINLSPEEFIKKYYEQYLTILQDNDPDWLLERYINSFTQVYDPHTTWMSPSTSEDFRISMKLSLVGIGAMLRTEDGMAKIVQVMSGGPADRDGRLQAGDKIIAVAQGDEKPVNVLHWPLNKTVKLIRGEKNTKVVLSVIPAADITGTRVKKIDIIRDEVKLEEQAAKSKLHEITNGNITNKLGVVTLPDFYLDMDAIRKDPNNARSSSRDVKDELEKMIKEGAQGIVLDLRNNGGGALEEAINIAGLFISSGPVVQVKNRYWGIKVYSDTDPETTYGGPLVVLVNHLSASASEIVAAALQDYGRAVVIGDTKTHGKGTVQTVIPLVDRDEEKYGNLKITTASFYRIAGGSTQLKGVIPDIIIPSPFDALDIGEESLPHALEWSSVGRAWFRRDRSLNQTLPALRARSENRRQGNEEFLTYLDRINRSAERINSGEISLNLDERLQLARTEDELNDIQEESLPDLEEDDESKPDLVLDEALQVLIDMLTANHKIAGS